MGRTEADKKIFDIGGTRLPGVCYHHQMCASAFANEVRVFYAAGASPRLSHGVAKENDMEYQVFRMPAYSEAVDREVL